MNKKKRNKEIKEVLITLFISVLFIALIMIATAMSFSGAILYEYSNGATTTFGTSSGMFRAQSFQIGGERYGANMTLSGITTYIQSDNNDGGILCIGIYNISGALPTEINMPLAVNCSYSNTDFVSPIMLNITFPASINLINNTNYSIVFNSTSGSTDSFRLYGGGDGYSKGSELYKSSPTWSVESPAYDLYFEIWGNSTSTIPPTPQSIGYISQNCYQEYSNVSTNCGGFSNGTYAKNADWTDVKNIYDGDFSTFGLATSTVGELYINYTKPLNAGNMSLWQVKDEGAEVNLSILDTCWDYNGKLEFLIESRNTIPAHTKYYCYDGSWKLLRDYSGDYKLYEEAMIWNMTGFKELNYSYASTVYETAQESFSMNITYNSNTWQGISANFIYNNLSYPTTITGTGDNKTLTSIIEIPTMNLSSKINHFFWNVAMTDKNGITLYFNSTNLSHTENHLILTLCNASYTTSALNLSIYDEINSKILDSGNSTNFQVNFHYWLGAGNIYQNYSFQNLSSSKNNYSFCIAPQDKVFHADMDSLFSATGYGENSYTLRNATLTNISTELILYLLPSTSNKFYITLQNGVTLMSDTTVTISKFFTGEGIYKTTGIKQTDNSGQFTSYLDTDKQYQFSIVKDGVFYGIISKTAICSTTPCTMTLQVSNAVTNIFSGYYDVYAQNILSNLTFNQTTKQVKYTFFDTTGLAHYFRLKVNKVILNESTNEAICDSYLYSSSGTLTCDLSSYDGDFIANGYISRSPDKIDKTISFIISNILSTRGLGLMGIFLCIGIIITIVFAIAVTSRGNPAAITMAFALSVLGLKLMQLFPFSWIIVSIIELGCIYIIMKVKT